METDVRWYKDGCYKLYFIEKIKEIYQNIGYPVIETIAKECDNKENGIYDLEKYLKENINAFSVNSGV